MVDLLIKEKIIQFQFLKWSPDSSMILAGCPSKIIQNNSPDSFNGAEIWSIKDPSWKCIINLGSAGLATASWAPDSRHVITVDEFYVTS